MAGCGGRSSQTTLTGNTAVTVLASSTANDQLFQFSVTLQSLTLVSQSGKSVSVLTAPISEEFIHLNGRVEPLATLSIPQDVYTSAVATVSGAFPACAAAGIMDESLGGIQSPSDVTVDLPQPITITGTAMGLALNLQVAKSAQFNGGCSQDLTNTLFVTPVFNLTPVTIAAQPTNSANGKALDVEGLIGSVSTNGAGFSATALYSMNEGNSNPTWQVSVNSGAIFQGVGSAAELAAGMLVDMDLALQPDGSLLATRVAVYDTDAADLSVSFGPPSLTYSSNSEINALEVEQQGAALAELMDIYDFGNAAFQISGQLNNLQNLPFAATFNEANMADGQNILLTTHAQRDAQGFPPLPTPATTATLLPQTIDGTVSAISSSGGFTTYTVTLAPYDLFADLAVQPGQTTLLTDPSTVVVYADTNAKMLNTASLAVGVVFRFYGLVFNNNGTLRMDCVQVNDGVAE
jgi:type II secretory pathway pseudopilin PulG